MDEKNYTKREIDYHFEVIGKKLDEILEQTKKTNGRVTVIESWKQKSMGYTSGIGACILLIIGLCTYIFKAEINNLNTQNTHIKELITNHIE